MLKRLQKGGLTAYLKNTTLRLIAEGNENQAIENTANQAPSPDNIPKGCKTCIIESHCTGHKDSENKIGKKKKKDVQNANTQYAKNIHITYARFADNKR